VEIPSELPSKTDGSEVIIIHNVLKTIVNGMYVFNTVIWQHYKPDLYPIVLNIIYTIIVTRQHLAHTDTWKHPL